MEISPNDILIAVFDGEEIKYVYPTEYVARYMGYVCLDKIKEEE